MPAHHETRLHTTEIRHASYPKFPRPPLGKPGSIAYYCGTHTKKDKKKEMPVFLESRPAKGSSTKNPDFGFQRLDICFWISFLPFDTRTHN